MPIEQYTYWSVTINNPDENDYLIVRNPNEKYVRSLVWTPEVGEEGTQHIQAWVRLQRNQSLAFVKKLYPRAHLKPTDKDAYNENSHQYAQKNDETTAGNHHITLHDPLPANDTLLYKVFEQSFDRLLERDARLADHYKREGVWDIIQRINLKQLWCDIIEREMIMERSGLEKIFISPAYEKMKAKYWKEILLRLKHKQDGEDSVRTGGDAQSGSQESGGPEICEDYEDSEDEATEGADESGSSVSGSSYASTQH